MHDLLEEILLSNTELKEVAIVPYLEGGSWFIEGPLLIIVESCAVKLVQEHEESFTANSRIILQILAPDRPSCSNYSELPDNSHEDWSSMLRGNTIALRSHPNSSLLWKFRGALLRDCTSIDEGFLLEIQNFKAFNYHLFDYILNRKFTWDQVKMVVFELVKAEPNNFSPYYVLLAYLQEETCLTRYKRVICILNSLPTLLKNETFLEFIMAILLLDRKTAEIQAIKDILDSSRSAPL